MGTTQKKRRTTRRYNNNKKKKRKVAFGFRKLIQTHTGVREIKISIYIYIHKNTLSGFFFKYNRHVQKRRIHQNKIANRNWFFFRVFYIHCFNAKYKSTTKTRDNDRLIEQKIFSRKTKSRGIFSFFRYFSI
jgi:hypothetical protein